MGARVATSLAVVMLQLLLVACSHENDESEDRAGPSYGADEDGVRAFAEDYVAALRAGQPNFCDFLAEGVREADPLLASAEDCDEAAENFASSAAEDPGDFAETFGGEAREIWVDGDRARFVLGAEEGDGVVLHLVRDGDSWLIDDFEGEYSYDRR